ncbi:hypothetical protein Tco_0527510 [Tanacetum coccineum]
MILGQPVHTDDNVETTEFNRGWPLVSAVLGQMAHIVASITLNSLHFLATRASIGSVVLSVFAMLAACASRAAKTLSETSFLMAARVMTGASDVDVLLGGILST